MSTETMGYGWRLRADASSPGRETPCDEAVPAAQETNREVERGRATRAAGGPDETVVEIEN